MFIRNWVPYALETHHPKVVVSFSHRGGSDGSTTTIEWYEYSKTLEFFPGISLADVRLSAFRDNNSDLIITSDKFARPIVVENFDHGWSFSGIGFFGYWYDVMASYPNIVLTGDPGLVALSAGFVVLLGGPKFGGTFFLEALNFEDGTINLSQPLTLRGLDSADIIYGFDRPDIIVGLAGDDYVSGYAGDDIIDGGVGDDELRGDAGDDIIDGGAGNDRLFGDADDDTIYGREGDDTVYGTDADGDDVVSVGSGNDIIYEPTSDPEGA